MEDRNIVNQIVKIRNATRVLREDMAFLQQRMWTVIHDLDVLCENIKSEMPHNIVELNPPEQPKDYPPIARQTNDIHGTNDESG
jgi:hypothetical protein